MKHVFRATNSRILSSVDPGVLPAQPALREAEGNDAEGGPRGRQPRAGGVTRCSIMHTCATTNYCTHRWGVCAKYYLYIQLFSHGAAVWLGPSDFWDVLRNQCCSPASFLTAQSHIGLVLNVLQANLEIRSDLAHFVLF